MLFVQDRVPSSRCGSLQPRRDFSWGGQIHPRQCVKGDVLELHETEGCSLGVLVQPIVSCAVVVGIGNEGLGETPTTILASLDGDLQHTLPMTATKSYSGWLAPY